VQARATYKSGRERHGAVVTLLDTRASRIARARLFLAVVALGCLAAAVWWRPSGWAWPVLAADALLFAVLVVVHARLDERARRASTAVRFYERGLARLDHDWDRLPTANGRPAAPDHPFASDLDVFGRASVMQVVDATETHFGQDTLAEWLAATDPGPWPGRMMDRQKAVRELADRLSFREALATAGGVLSDERPDPSQLLRWAAGTQVLAPALRVGVRWLPVATAGALATAHALGAPGETLTLMVVLAMAAGILASRSVPRTLDAVSARESTATRWRAMLAAIEGEPFAAPLLLGLQARLSTDGRRASEELAALERIIGFVDARRNELFRFFIGPLLMWDIHCAVALERWRARAGARLRGWLDAIGEVEAAAGLAAFAFEHPEFAWPEPSPTPTFEALGLAHPMIPSERRVANDVRLSAAGRALVVTGSNMSGKSTLLRAIGVNAILAFAGAPVCARSLRIGALRVATSMRVEDSLAQGVSHFYAEVRRLKRVVDLAHEPPPAPPVLFLLDEILHGTNSRERVLGASAVVRDLLAHGGLGAVSTHDLGITALGRELGGAVENVHFEEQVTGDAMTFDYALRPGIVESSNALRLMRSMGIEVVEPG